MKGCLAKFNDSLNAFLRRWPHLHHFAQGKLIQNVKEIALVSSADFRQTVQRYKMADYSQRPFRGHRRGC